MRRRLPRELKRRKQKWTTLDSVLMIVFCIIMLILSIIFKVSLVGAERSVVSYEYDYTDEQICDAIYIAEGGEDTKHPYGILTKYKTTTPRQACINTVAHARRDWYKEGDFIVFLGNRYAPVGAENDPTHLNENWVKNVNYYLTHNK